MEGRWCVEIAQQVMYWLEHEAQRRKIMQAEIGAAMFQGLSTAQKAYSDLIAGKRKLTIEEACAGLSYLGMDIDRIINEICALNRRGIKIEPPPVRAKGGPRKKRKKNELKELTDCDKKKVVIH